MNRQQFKKLRHDARVCRKSVEFRWYDEDEPIPEKLQPFLLPKPRPSSPINMLELRGLIGSRGGLSKHLEWAKKRIRANHTGINPYS